jgi:ankyrin repeat protein
VIAGRVELHDGPVVRSSDRIFQTQRRMRYDRAPTMRRPRAGAPDPPIDPKNLKLFFKAVKEGRPVAIRRQIARGMPVDARDEAGFTALHVAVLRKNAALVEVLLDKGASPNHRADRIGSVLRSAAFGGSPEILRRLIEAGADVARFGGEALLSALRRKHVEAARVLLEAGADANAIDDDCSPLETVMRGGLEELVPLLLASGANPNGAGYSRPLSIAAKEGRIDLLRSLLDAGADPNGANEYGDTALMTAATYGQVAAAEVLKQAGARIDAREARVGSTALMEAARAGELEMARWLVAAGADVRLTNTDGKNALTLALETRDRVGAAARGVVVLGSEGAIAVVEQHAHGVAPEVRDGEVGHSITVQIRCRDRPGVVARGVVDLGGEGAIAAIGTPFRIFTVFRRPIRTSL